MKGFEGHKPGFTASTPQSNTIHSLNQRQRKLKRIADGKYIYHTYVHIHMKFNTNQLFWSAKDPSDTKEVYSVYGTASRC